MCLAGSKSKINRKADPNAGISICLKHLSYQEHRFRLHLAERTEIDAHDLDTSATSDCLTVVAKLLRGGPKLSEILGAKEPALSNDADYAAIRWVNYRTSRVSAIDGTVEVEDSVRDEAADDCRLHQ